MGYPWGEYYVADIFSYNFTFYHDCHREYLQLCQPIRMILEYAGADWIEVQESCEGPPNYSKDEWLSKKFTLGLDFPNLPYLMDGKIKY